MFTILRAYVCNFESILTKYADSSVTLLLRASRSLDAVLDDVLRLLIKVRDRKDPFETAGSRGGRRRRKKDDMENKNIIGSGENPCGDCDQAFVLIWDDAITTETIGGQRDCVWLAEQLWNLAVLLSAKAETRFIAAELYTKAHDFALLSEEEEGKALSRGFLDFERSSSASNENVLLPFIKTKSFVQDSHDVCDLSSEFSAQCLLLAVANAVDARSGEKNDAEKLLQGDNRACMRKSIRRLKLAYHEFVLNRPEQYTNDWKASLPGSPFAV